MTLNHGQYVSSGEHLVRGEPIPLEKGCAYVQRAWLRDAGDGGYVHFGRNYLDSKGTVLKTSECPDSPALSWREVSQRLLPTGDPNGIADAVPLGTVSVEPYLKWYRAVDWTGLYLGRLD